MLETLFKVTDVKMCMLESRDTQLVLSGEPLLQSDSRPVANCAYSICSLANETQF